MKIDSKYLSKHQANPLNQTGSKFRYRSTLAEYLPNIENLKVLDPFVGGGDMISFLPESWTINASDISGRLIDIHLAMQTGLITVDKVLELYTQHGLSRDNKEEYYKFREHYNQNNDPVKLYTLITNSFNNQMRFSYKSGFNIPFGKREFNTDMQSKLENYQYNIQSRNIQFICCSFDLHNFNDYDILLLDPPYLNTVATYNDIWTPELDIKLLNKIDDSGKDFVYFNQIVSKGIRNEPLIEWAKKYNVIELAHTTRHCNYQRTDLETIEVMITNLEPTG